MYRLETDDVEVCLYPRDDKWELFVNHKRYCSVSVEGEKRDMLLLARTIASIARGELKEEV